MSDIEFAPFPKMARLNRDIVITEKIDGTNAQIVFEPDGTMHVGSRKRWITPGDDNFGFARWCADHEDELRVVLGEGTHFGEWWGSGIQRGYGLEKGVKRFSLFNTSRWENLVVNDDFGLGVVPVLFTGQMSLTVAQRILLSLERKGSVAAPGFMKPEGIVLFHTAANLCFKATVENDEKPKGQA